MEDREHIDAIANELEPRQRAAFLQRVAIVKRFAQARDQAKLAGRSITPVAEKLVRELWDEGMSIGVGTLHNWWRAFRCDGVEGLVDRRGTRKGVKADRFLAKVKELYLRPDFLNIESCHILAEMEASRNGWPVCTIRETTRFIRKKVLPLLRRRRVIKSNGPARRRPGESQTGA